MSELTRWQLIGFVISMPLALVFWFGLGWHRATLGVVWGTLGITTTLAFVRQECRFRRERRSKRRRQ